MSFDNVSNAALSYIVQVFSNCLSIVACLMIIALWFLAKDLRVYAFKLVTYLAVLDLLKSSTMLIPTYDSSSDDLACIIQATLYQFFTIASFQLTLLMAISLYLCILKNLQEIEKYEKMFIFVIFLCSAGGTVPIIVFEVWGRVNYWCWVTERHMDFRFITFYGPLWLENLINLYLYCQVIQKLKHEDLEIYRLRFYPLILILCYLPATVIRVLEACNINVPYGLVVSTTFCDGILGLVNCICYGLTKHVKIYIYSFFKSRNRSLVNELNEFNSFSNLP